MTTLELVLGASTVLLAMIVLVLVATDDDDPSDAELDDDTLRASVGDALRDLDLDRNAALIENHATEMRTLHDNVEQLHTDLEQLLTNPQQRGSFGEYQLETILADQLPPDMYGTQEAVVANLRPDAHVETSAGTVAIDAKLPLEAYERAVDAEDPAEQRRQETAFARRVEEQLEKIATAYVRPDEGTAPFALAFIPSEAVYYHLLTEEYDLLTEYGDRGVQVVSPLTLGQKLQLVKAGVHAQRLTDRAEAVQSQLDTLSNRFDGVADDWDTCMRHLRNALDRAEDADRAFDRLRTEFQRVDRLDDVEDSSPSPVGDRSRDTAEDGSPIDGTGTD